MEGMRKNMYIQAYGEESRILKSLRVDFNKEMKM